MREAIEKEAGDDSIVVLRGQLGGEDIGRLEINMMGRLAEPFFGAGEHGVTDIEAIDLSIRCDGDKPFQAATVAFSKNENVAAILQMRQQRKSRTFEVAA